MKKISILTGVLCLALTACVACSIPIENVSSSSQDSVSSSVSEEKVSSSTEISSALASSETAVSSDEVTSENSSITEESSAREEVSSDEVESEESVRVEESSAHEESSTSEEKETYYTVTFDTDGGTAIADVKVLSGEKISAPATPTKITHACEYVFIGWFYNGEAWDFDNGVVMQDMTLLAHWEEGERFTDAFLPKD